MIETTCELPAGVNKPVNVGVKKMVNGAVNKATFWSAETCCRFLFQSRLAAEDVFASESGLKSKATTSRRSPKGSAGMSPSTERRQLAPRHRVDFQVRRLIVLVPRPLVLESVFHVNIRSSE